MDICYINVKYKRNKERFLMSKGILYTSYFGNWRKWKQLDAFTVAICRKKTTTYEL